MQWQDAPRAIDEDLAAETCESCGRRPARWVTVRRHVGLFYLQRFVTVKALACRSCGRRLVRDFTLRTLAQGWWGLISFFFNWFVLAANAAAWLKLGRLNEPLAWEADTAAVHPGPAAWGIEQESSTRSWARKAAIIPGVLVAGLAVLGLAAWGWDATHHDHEGPHGVPLTALEVKQEMAGQMFLTDNGLRMWVESADCRPDGASRRDVHFRCHVVFNNGQSDDVLVHVERAGLFFKSSSRGA